MFTATLQLTKSATQIERDLLRLLRDQITSRWTDNLPKIRHEFVEALDTAIINSNEYKALMPGHILSSEFGLPSEDAKRMVDDIKSIWLSEVHVSLTPIRVTSSNALSGGFKIRAINSNQENVLRSHSAVVKYYSERYLKDVTLPWLEWLLFLGDTLISDEFQVYYNIGGVGKRTSRSGNALMAHLSGQSTYSVNPKYSGVKSANWTHRFLEPLKSQLGTILDKYI